MFIVIFVAVCRAYTHFGQLRRALDVHFCRYLLCLRAFCRCHHKSLLLFVSLFVALTRILDSLGEHWICMFVAICRAYAHFVD
jgi:hypothetical protein